MSVLERNLEALADRHPGLDRGLLRSAAEEDHGPALTILPTPAGAPTAVLEGAYLHSRYDPLREARRIAREAAADSPTLVLFYGFGLGYLVEQFLEAVPDVPVAVVEPELALFCRVLRSRDLVTVLSDPRVHWFAGVPPEELLPRLEELPLDKVRVIRLRPLYERNASYYQRLDGLVSAAQSRLEVNFNTLKRFARLWVRNLSHNLPPLLASPGVGRLADRFRGLPATILAAGPSLEGFLAYLPRLRERSVIVAVDTSLRLCLRRGVEPDFLVVVDPQYWNARHLDRSAPRRTVLISDSSTHPSVFRRLALPVFLASSIFPLGEYLENAVGTQGRLGAGGSVATSAWDFARLAGAAPILMAGLDLGFPGRRTHARGTFFEELRHILSGRLEPAEGLACRYLREAGPFLCPANSGGATLSDQRLIIYRWWFEGQMRLHPAAETWNLSAEGIRIDGMPYHPVEEALRLPVIRAEIDRRMEEVRSLRPEQAPAGAAARRERLRQALDTLLGDLDRLQALTAEGLRECRDLQERLLRGQSPGEALGRLDRVDAGILGTVSRQVAAFLVQPLIREISRRAAPAAGRDVVELSAALYRELHDSAGYHRDMLSRARGRLQGNRPEEETP